jgi:hypothetical protein
VSSIYKSASRRRSTLISSNPGSVKLNPIPLQPADTRSFIFNDLPYVAFAVQNANNVEGVCLQSVINPNTSNPATGHERRFELADC